MSKPSQLDPERLAALMDGKLSASEAAEVRAALAASDSDVIESFADATAVVAELAMVRSKVVRQPRSRRSIYWWSMAAGLAAAALALVVVKGPGSERGSFSAAELVAGLPSTVAAPATNAWPVRRGTADVVPAQARAARLGALFVDLELAARARDSAALRRTGAEIIAVADDIPGASSFLPPFRSLLDGSDAANPTTRQEAGASLARLAGRAWVSAGAAAEAVRAASESRDPTAIIPVCTRSAELQQRLSIPMPPADVLLKDSLTQALAQNPCSIARVGALSAALLAAITK